MKKNESNHLDSKTVLNASTHFGMTVLRLVFLLMMCFVVLYPILYMFSVSVREANDLYDPTVIWIPRNFTMENYTYIWELIDYPKVLGETAQITVISTIIHVFISAMIGYGFARFNFRFKGVLFGLVIFTLLVPSQLVSIPMYVQYRNFDFFGLGQLGLLFGDKPWTVNLLDTHAVYYVPALVGQGLRSGLFVFIFRQFFRSMPKELEDAAAIDGCNSFGTFLKIMIPCAGPAFVTTILFSAVWYWNEYYMASMYFTDSQTLAMSLGTLQSLLRSVGHEIYKDPYSVVVQMQSACVLTILPLIILFVVMQSKFTESIDKTGIVG